MEDVVIESAAVSDAERVLALQRSAYQSEAELYHDWNLPPLRETLVELVATFETHVILKAVLHGAIVGSVRARQVDHTCSIGRLMVDPRLQRRGIGTALLHHIEACFPAAEQFQLFTGTQSEANMRLYRRLGYSIVGTERLNERVSVAIMTKAQ